MADEDFNPDVAEEEDLSEDESENINDTNPGDDEDEGTDQDDETEEEIDDEENDDSGQDEDTTDEEDTSTDDSSSSDEVTVKGAIPKSLVVTNPLHAYSSYTYGLSLHMLNKEDFNKMASNPDSDWMPTSTLIGAGGKWGQPGYRRDDAFLDDFFFDNFKITSIIGNTTNTRGTNGVEMSFTIIEPYGFTLIDRLIDACLDPRVKGQDYLQVPYLMQLDFFGYDDEGKGVNLLDQRKFIPLNINGMSIKTGIKGTEYNITATPYAHEAFKEGIAGTPANFEITASTLQDFFEPDANVEDALKKYNERAEAEKQAADKQNADDTRTESKTSSTTSSDADTKSSSYEVRSFVAAYNAWSERTVKNKNAMDFNTIRVVFDPKILEASNGQGGQMVNEQSTSSKRVAEKDAKNNSKDRDAVIRGNAGKATASPNFNVAKFSISGGTAITTVINNAMLSSKYIRDQIKDTTKGVEENVKELQKDIDWWKIIPSVKLRKFCTLTNKWYLDVTYYVQSYTVYNRTHPNAPKSLPTKIHKVYNYIFTGKNYDIIDFALDFDATFVTAVTIDRGKQQAVEGPQPGPDQEDNQEQVLPQESNPNRGRQSPVTPVKKTLVADQAPATATGDLRKDSKAMAAASVAEFINSGEAADQLQVKLKIVGDPQFIKQDDVYMSPEARRASGDEQFGSGFINGDPSQSLETDDGEIHVKLFWKTPVDFDEETGGFRENGRYLTSKFSGIYNVLQVESIFSQGKFEQTLDLVRLPDQPQDYPAANVTSKDIRSTNSEETGKEENGEGETFGAWDDPPEETDESPTDEDVKDYMERHPDEPSDQTDEPSDEQEETEEQDEELSNVANSDEEATDIDEHESEENSSPESSYPEP